jgi:D,D-heptose 1,7-bisphosphate phosphatase
MPVPAIFFDRDNTLILNDGYLGDPAGVVLAPGAAEAIARGRELGFAVVTVSNQSGVAKGLFTEEAVVAVNARMSQLLLQEDPRAIIDRHEFCPFHPDGVVERYRQESPLRKPRPGMLLQAAAAMNIDLSQSWLIGDAPRDIQAGQASGCRTVLLQLAGLPAFAAAGAEAAVHGLAAAIDFVAAQKKATDLRGGGGPIG